MTSTQVDSISPVARTWKHAWWEFKLNIRHGEQLLLLVIIPMVVLITLTQTSVIGGEKWDLVRALSASLSISTLAAGFTSLAISTAFERRSGTLLAMGTTPLTRIELVVGKGLSIFFLTLVSTAVLSITSIILGWRPSPIALLVLPIILLGILSVSGVAFLLAGTCRAELVLALANGIFVMAMIFGGIIFQYGEPMRNLVDLFPPSAIYSLLSYAFAPSELIEGSVFAPLIVLVIWAVAGNFIAARFFRWR